MFSPKTSKFQLTAKHEDLEYSYDQNEILTPKLKGMNKKITERRKIKDSAETRRIGFIFPEDWTPTFSEFLTVEESNNDSSDDEAMKKIEFFILKENTSF